MRNTANTVLENNFFSRLGQLINLFRFRFPIEQNQNLAIQLNTESSDSIAVDVANTETYTTINNNSKFATNPLPIGTADVSAFNTIVEKESTLSNSSFIIELRLNKGNCSFLTDTAQKDLAIDCLKTVVKTGLSAKAYTFSPSHKIFLLYTNVSAETVINKANKIFRQVQKMLRAELDSHQSLMELNIYKVQDCVPCIS